MKKVNIGKKSKVVIKWNVLPIDYSHEKERNIISKFAKKYGISKDMVSVDPQFISKNENGEIVDYANDITENIQDVKFQQKLFKRYLDEKGVKDYDFNMILDIDQTINNHINYELYDQHKRYAIKWVKWSNFMSYGPDNYFDFTSLNGLVLLSSEPANQGGKTTFCLDLLRFLLFGKVTSRENDWTLSKIFNKHIPEATECFVEGCINIDGVDYIIRRTVTRPQLSKRTEKSKTTQKLEYFKLVNNELIDLYDEDNLESQDEVTNRETNKVIKDAIGNERDFDLMICVDADNLKGLISLKDTDRGRLISRWIGLLPLEDKDKIARETFNHDILPSLIINKYDKEELKTLNLEYETSNKNEENIIKTLSKKLVDNEKLLEQKKITRDNLLSSKNNIDDNLLKIDVNSLETKIENIITKGKELNIEKENILKELNEIGEVDFSQEEYDKLVNDKMSISSKIAEARINYKNIKEKIDTLKKGEFCPTCGAKLKNIDNSKEIEIKEKELLNMSEDGKKLNEKFNNIEKQITNLNSLREKYNKKIKNELILDKKNAEIETVRANYREQKQLLDDIKKNKSAIEKNNKLDIEINNTTVEIKTCENIIKQVNNDIQTSEVTIRENNKRIDENKAKIERITKEEAIVYNWKLYLDMIGKNGISKLVIRQTLPLINGELHHMLHDVCDFDVEICIDNHNDVAFNLIHDNVKSNLASGSGFEQTVASLALRSVLSKISTFSKPSFVVFDEILGGVAEENYDTVKLLYDKIAINYQFVFQITHNVNIRDWHNQEIVVTKNNNISKIKTK